MTTIIAKKYGYKVSLVADTQVTSEYTVSRCRPNKLFKCHGIVWGFCGNSEYIKMFERFIKERKFYYENETIDAYLDDLMINLRSYCIDNNYIASRSEKERYYTGLDGLCAYKNRLFEISGYFTQEEVKDFAAIGSGRDFALGILLWDEYADIGDVVKVVSKLDVNTSPPVTREET